MNNTAYHEILREICTEENIALTSLSNGWVLLLERAGQRHFIVGYKFDLTRTAAGLVADDKYATFTVLHAAGLPVIEHRIIYESTNCQNYAQGCNTLAYIVDYLQKWDEKIVIKPNNGTTGHNVFCVTKANEIPKVLQKVFHQSYSASICPFYDIQHEYRVILLDDEEQLAYQKTRGDDWRFNLHCGAKANKISDQVLHTQILNLAKRAALALGLRFCSVDIIQTQDGELMVMEANSGVMVKEYLEQHPEEQTNIKRMYQLAIRKMFE